MSKSEVEKLNPMTSRDESIIETIKYDNVSNAILQSTNSASKYVKVMLKNFIACVEKVEASTETKHLVEIGSRNMLEGVANSNTNIAQSKITDINGEIMNVIAKDASELQINTQTLTAEIDDSSVNILQDEEVSQKFVDEQKADKSTQNTRSNVPCTSTLEVELLKRTKERDIYQKKLEDMEIKLAALQVSYNTIMTNQNSDESNLHQSIQQLHSQLAQTALMYEERNRMVANQENQINALNNQVASLKEVVSITRDLLQIRNMEVKQLQTEVDNMEKKLSEEHDRHNAIINKMDTAMQLNADLKKEYETQLSLFQNLRENYNKKLTLLTAEKQALDTTVSISN